uniref:Uncharacterized protein n=1 Tax=viral metagenome TaxID=1070528 RepID=A0A6H1ZNN0_9ZZZZ
MKYSDMKKVAQDKGAVANLTPQFFVFDTVGGGFCGRLKALSAVTSGLSQGTYNQYLFEVDAGLIKCAFGAATDKEVAPMLRVGNIYIVEYKGKEKISGGRSVNKFHIEEIDEAALTVESQGGGLDKKGAKR